MFTGKYTEINFMAKSKRLIKLITITKEHFNGIIMDIYNSPHEIIKGIRKLRI